MNNVTFPTNPPLAIEPSAVVAPTTLLARAWIGIDDRLSDSAACTAMHEGRRARDTFWQTAALVHEQAYVASLRNLEMVAEKEFATGRELEAALSFIEEARALRRHDQFVPFAPPDLSEIRPMRSRHFDSDLVLSGLFREVEAAEFGCRQDLLHAIGEHWIWYAVRHAVDQACVASVRSVDPTIKWDSGWRIKSILDRVLREQGFRNFRPDVAYVMSHR